MSGRKHGPGKHRGWLVSGVNSAEVGYRSKAAAKSVAKNVKGGKASSSVGCAIILLLVPLLPLLFVIGTTRVA